MFTAATQSAIAAAAATAAVSNPAAAAAADKYSAEYADTRAAARLAFAEAKAAGAADWDAAQTAWKAVRRLRPRLRAPYWAEQVWANGGSARSYRSPLGAATGVAGRDYGHHCAKWPRTRRSEREAAETAETVLAWLRGA